MSVVSWRPCRHLAVMLGALVVLLTLPTLSLAQGSQSPKSAESADALTVDPEQLEQLIGTLEDPDARARFVEQLRALAQAADATEAKPASVDEMGLDLVALLTARVNAFVQGLVDLSAVIVDLPDLMDWLWFQASDPTARAYWFEFLGVIALVLALAVLAHRLMRYVLAGFMHQLEQAQPETVAERCRPLLKRAGLRLLPIAAFAGAGYAVLWVANGRFSTEIVATSLVHATVFSMLLLVGVRVMLSPGAPNLRLSRISDEFAQYLYLWFKRFIYLVAFSYVIFQNELLLQIPASIYAGIERMLGLLVAIAAIVFIVQNRKPVAHWLRGNGHSSGSLAITRRLIADIWPLFAIFYVLGTFLVWALEVPGGFQLLLRGAVVTTLLVAMARPLAFAVKRVLGQRLWVGPDFWHRYPALGRRINRYLALFQRIAGGLVYLVILLALVHVWGIDLFGWFGSMFGNDSLDRLTTIGMVILLTWIIWEVTSTLIENYLDATDEGGTRVERSGRARTLLPLLRTFLLVLISIVVVLTAMSTLGVDITPLLAAAGVVGIAVGFGAQKLVQDVINGLFILFQDTISVGDVVDVGGHAGLVEKISVRTIGLRDLAGNVHTIPFSEVHTITNMTKEYSYADLSIGVAYRENVDDVMEVVRQLGAELEADPEYGQYMLEPIEVLGVDAFADSAVIIKARIKTKSLKQWYVRREFNRLMKHRFDELGIEIPFPHQTLYFGQDKAGAAPPMHLRTDDEASTPVKATPRRRKPLRVVKADDPKSPIEDHE